MNDIMAEMGYIARARTEFRKVNNREPNILMVPYGSALDGAKTFYGMQLRLWFREQYELRYEAPVEVAKELPVPKVKFDKVGRWEEGTHPSPSYDDNLYALVTVAVLDGDMFGESVQRLARQLSKKWATGPVLMTTASCWSGYSEATITSEWQEVWISLPEIGFEQKFATMPEFFEALKQAELAA